jgi:roadblock/LC7 domain-containing protein
MGSGASFDKGSLETDAGELGNKLKKLSEDELAKIEEAVSAARKKIQEDKDYNEDPKFGCYSDTLGEMMLMFPGAMLVSKNRVYKAVFQEDGNFVVYKGVIDAENALWASDTCGSDGKRLCLQGDQHLVMYDEAWENVAWSTGCFDKGKSPVRLVMQDDGNLVQYNAMDEAMWATKTNDEQLVDGKSDVMGGGQKVAEEWEKSDEEGDKMAGQPNKLGMNTAMLTGGDKCARLVSENKEYFAIMQGDGNFVVYKGDEPLWASETVDSGGDRMVLQGDQHLVMYAGKLQDGDPKWKTDVLGKDDCPHVQLVMQDDGNLVQYNQDVKPMWCTRTDGGPSPCMGAGEKCMEE